MVAEREWGLPLWEDSGKSFQTIKHDSQSCILETGLTVTNSEPKMDLRI